MPKLSRRTVLRGLGTAVALPLLEGMVPTVARAAPAPTAPTRMAFIFVPNGIHMQDWTPKQEGANFELPATLQPLSAIKNQLTVFSGLTHDKARANGDGPGDHARSASTFLTACQARKTHGADINVGVSVDQVAAQKLGSRTSLPSLELGVDRGANAGNCDSGYSCAYSHNISWRSPTTPQAKEINPRLVFERLFGGDDQEQAASNAKRRAYKRSILDFVQEDARGLRQRLGINDQRKMDEYLASVREIEQRIQHAEKAKVAKAPPGYQKPSGVPEDNAEHIRLMFDILALAFQADITRIATFMMANEGSNRSYRNIGVSEGHHDLSHHGNDKGKQEKIAKINRHHMELFAAFCKKLSDLKEGDQPLLDRCLVLYGCAIGDGNAHNHDDLPLLIAGGGNGTLRQGRHLTFPRNTPVANLFLSMLDGFGCPIDKLGDSTGKLKGLKA